jgi:transposase
MLKDNDFSKEEFIKMYEGGMTNKEIAEKMGKSVQTVIKYAKDFGLKMKGRGNKTKKVNFI